MTSLHVFEYRRHLCLVRGAQNLHRDAELARRDLQSIDLPASSLSCRIRQHADALDGRHYFAQRFKSLHRDLRRHTNEACRVATRACEARDQSIADRVSGIDEDDAAV